MTTHNEDTANAGAVTDAATAAAASAGTPSAANTGAATADDDGGSLLDGVKVEGADTSAPKPLAERIPEKYRVTGADGKLDEAASMAKVLDGYEHLSKKLGSGAEGAPATPDEYKLELLNAEGKPRDDIDIEAFTGDPMFKGFAKGAHEQGINNAQLNWVVGRYLEVAPQLLAANAEITREEAVESLSKIWADKPALEAGTRAAVSAMKAYGSQAEDAPGNFEALKFKFGNDPDFIAFAAAVGRELGEDRPPGGDAVGALGDGDIEALQKGESYWNPNHPDHARTKQKVDEFYARKFGSKRR